jgi:dicarboxylate transporter 10
VQAAKGNTSALALVREAIKKDGPLVMMRGFVPAWIRLQPQSTLLFFFL